MRPAPAGDAGTAATLDVDLERAVAGGFVLGREPDGRVVLVSGGLPGERVRVRVRSRHRRHSIAELEEVLEPSDGRVEPPCPEVARGCGGCDLQHATLALQREMKLEVLRDALRRIGGAPEVEVRAGADLPAEGYRSTLRLAVARTRDATGRAGFRRRSSHDVVDVAGCLVAHPRLSALVSEGDFGEAEEVVLRTSVATGETLALMRPTAAGARLPGDVRVFGADELRRGRAKLAPWMAEEVEGHRLRVSIDTFFQSGPAGAAALGAAVRRALPGFAPGDDRLADLYGGLGLFTVLLGASRSVVVERSRAAVADAAVNTSPSGAEVVRRAVGEWSPSPADVVVADPPREGLGADGVAAVTGTGARGVALVSCDPASLGRDVALMARHGYRLTGVELVDQFAHTHHIEAVASFEAGAVAPFER